MQELDFQPQPEKQTVASILWRKLHNWFDNSSASHILRRTIETFVALMVALAFVAPEETYQAAAFAISFYSFALPKFVLGFLVVTKRKTIKRLYTRLMQRGENQHTIIGGVPKTELVDFLFDTGAFKYEQARKRFSMSRKNYDKLAGKLESIGLLVRGEKNARVRNTDLSREQVAHTLENAKDYQTLKPAVSQWKILKHREDEPAISFIETRHDFSTRTITS